MLRLAFSTLAARKGGTFGAFAAVTLAFVLVASCGVLLESSLRAPIPVDRLAAAAVVVQADSTLQPQDGQGSVSLVLPEQTRVPDTLRRRLEGIPGVRRAIADRTFAAEVVDEHDRVLTDADEGHGWSSAALTPLRLSSGHSPTAAADVVVDAAAAPGTHLGERLRIDTTAGRRTFTVVGIATSPRSSRHPAVYVRDDVARHLSARADLVGLLLERGVDPADVADRARDTLDGSGLRVLTGAKRGEAESVEGALAREDIVASLTVFGVLAAFVAVFVVSSAFALSVQQRHRELALFRAIGSTPKQVRRMVAAEALVISVLAAAVGAPLTVLFAFLERRVFSDAHMLPSDLKVVIGWIPFAGALLMAIVTTQLAAFASARRASRIRPIDALREAAVERRTLPWLRGLAGLAALGGGIAVLITTAGGGGSDAPAAAMVWMVAAALLAPGLALPFTWLLGAPLRLFTGGPGFLAGANTRANLRRVASIATPLMLTVSVASTVLFSRTTIERQTSRQAAQSITAENVLRPTESGGLAPGVAAAARRVPGVEAASGSFATSVEVVAGGNLRLLPARAVDAATLPDVVDLGVASGAIADVRGASLAVSTPRAKELGWRLGDRVKVWLGDGTPARLRVAAIYDRPLGFGEIVLPRRIAAPHVTSPFDDAVYVRSRSGLDARALGRLTRQHPTVEVATRSHYLTELKDEAQQESLVVYLLVGVVVVFSALAVVNALTMAIAERRRELALLRLVGATRRQLRRMVRAETLIVVLFGVTIGSLVAAPALAVFSYGLTGTAVPDVPLWMLGGIVAGAGLLALAATVLPTRLALRTNPIAAMGARE